MSARVRRTDHVIAVVVAKGTRWGAPRDRTGYGTLIATVIRVDSSSRFEVREGSRYGQVIATATRGGGVGWVLRDGGPYGSVVAGTSAGNGAIFAAAAVALLGYA